MKVALANFEFKNTSRKTFFLPFLSETSSTCIIICIVGDKKNQKQTVCSDKSATAATRHSKNLGFQIAIFEKSQLQENMDGFSAKKKLFALENQRGIKKFLHFLSEDSRHLHAFSCKGT